MERLFYIEWDSAIPTNIILLKLLLAPFLPKA